MRALPAEEIPVDLADAHLFVKACDLFDGFYHQLGEEDLRDAMGALSEDGEAVNLAKVMDEYVPFAQERYTRFQALLVRTVGTPPDSPVLCTAPSLRFGAWCVLARVADRRPRRHAVPTISPPHTSCSIFDTPTPLVCVCVCLPLTAETEADYAGRAVPLAPQDRHSPIGVFLDGHAEQRLLRRSEQSWGANPSFAAEVRVTGRITSVRARWRW